MGESEGFQRPGRAPEHLGARAGSGRQGRAIPPARGGAERSGAGQPGPVGPLAAGQEGAGAVLPLQRSGAAMCSVHNHTHRIAEATARGGGGRG